MSLLIFHGGFTQSLLGGTLLKASIPDPASFSGIEHIIFQVTQFGSWRYHHVDFISRSEQAFRHLFLPEWKDQYMGTDTYAFYTRSEFFHAINFAVKQVNSNLIYLMSTVNVRNVVQFNSIQSTCQTEEFLF